MCLDSRLSVYCADILENDVRVYHAFSAMHRRDSQSRLLIATDVNKLLKTNNVIFQ